MLRKGIVAAAVIMIIAVAAVVYYYSLPIPAKFEVSNLTVSPSEVEPGEEVTISATVTNIGDESGSYRSSHRPVRQ